ncbi:hypothetical protein EDD15DRAFT_2467633 [Pisolithus albus]|nr:hypothetical protein EDD15DRAFT_2467633 [Pisolithus albus]
MTIPGGFGEDVSQPSVVSFAHPFVIGANLIAGLFSAMLYGITTLQTYVYYMHYSEDSSTMKVVVAAIWILDTLNVSLMCHMLYYYLITRYGDPTSFEYIVWSFPASYLVNVRYIYLASRRDRISTAFQLFVVIIVRLFFAHKIYYLSRREVRWRVTAPIILLALAHFGFGMGVVGLILANDKISTATKLWFSTELPCEVTGFLSEVLITVSLCVLLYDRGSDSAFPRTKRLLNTLIVYAVNRCVLTFFFGVAGFVGTFNNQALWEIGMIFIMGKLYANSLLASLNTRQHLRSIVTSTVSNPHVGAIHFAKPPKLSGGIGSSVDGGMRFDDPRGMAVIDITTEPAFDKTTTMRRGAEV